MNNERDPWNGIRGESEVYSPMFNSYKHLPLTEILNEVATIVGKSFGPKGATTIIEDVQLRHKVTKDGYTILRSLTSPNDLERVVLEFAKRSSLRLVRTVGDGSTSAVICASKIANNLKKFMDKHPDIYKGDIIDTLKRISECIQARIKAETYFIDESKEADWEKIRNVAIVSTNNSVEAANLITDVYKKVGKFGVVNIQRGDRPNTVVDYKNGFEMYRGYVDDCFCNVKNDDKKHVELNNAYVLMYDGVLGTNEISNLAEIINSVVGGMGGSLLIIANNYTPDVVQFAKENVIRTKGTMPICLCSHATSSTQGKLHFSDIATYTNSRPIEYLSKVENLDKTVMTQGHIDVDRLMYRLGFAKRVVVTDMSTTFFEGRGIQTPEYAELKNSLQKKIAERSNETGHIDYDSEIGALKVRYGRLCAYSAVITVGGPSKAAMESFADLVEDAVLSCKSALQFGVTAAGNTIVPIILSDNGVVAKIKESVVADLHGRSSLTPELVEELILIIRTAFSEVFQLCSQLPIEEVEKLFKDRKIWNIRKHRAEDIASTEVLNSARTDKEIISEALSMVSVIVTSNGFLFCPRLS